MTDRRTDGIAVASTALAMPALRRAVKTSLDFNDARDDGVAVASAGPHASHLHLASDR